MITFEEMEIKQRKTASWTHTIKVELNWFGMEMSSYKTFEDDELLKRCTACKLVCGWQNKHNMNKNKKECPSNPYTIIQKLASLPAPMRPIA